MYGNYQKIAFRNIAKYKVYNGINMFGLALASAFLILVYSFIQHERSFDQFHDKASVLYRVELTGLGRVSSTETKDFFSALTHVDDSRYTQLPPGLAPALQSALPEIKQTFRFLYGREFIIGVNDKKFFQSDICLVDSNFFSLFSFSLVSGNPENVLHGSQSVVLTEKTAERYFAGDNPVGQTIEVFRGGKTYLFTVTGIVKDPPANSSIHFELLFPLHATGLLSPEFHTKKELTTLNTFTILELDQRADIAAFKQKLRMFAQRYYKEQLAKRGTNIENFGLVLTPLKDTHLDNIATSWPRMGKKLNLYLLGLIASLILLIASLNYVFLAITQASTRLQEVGVRKITGATRPQLIIQFWLENLMFVAMAVAVGFLLAGLFLPLFNEQLNSPMKQTDLYNPSVWTGAVLLVFLISLLTGVYPAVLLSGFKPVQLLKQNPSYRFRPFLARLMIMVQYAFCLFLIISIVIMWKQFRFISEKNLGFDSEQIVVIDLMENQSMEKGPYLLKQFKRLAESEAGILGVSGGDGMTGASALGFYKINDDYKTISKLSGDYDYIQLLGLEIIKGRNISPDYPSDTVGVGSVVINESLEELLGEAFSLGNPCRVLNNAKIIGVMKDFHFNTLSQPIGPALLSFSPSYIPGILVKIQPRNISETLRKLETEWTRYNDGKPLNYNFMDKAIENMYQEQVHWVNLINIATIFAILIACLGLFALSGLIAMNFKKQIGIRKVMGASVWNIFFLLNKSIFNLSLLSFLLAVPFAWYFMNKWLDDFAYRIEISWDIFTLTWLIGLFLALFSVGYNSLKSALSDPVKSIQN